MPAKPLTNLFFAKLLIIVVLSFTSFHSFAFNVFDIKNGETEARIPFKKVNDLIVMPVSINGEKPLNIILDTGIRSIVLFKSKYAKKLKLYTDRKVVFSGAGSNSLVYGYVSNGHTVTLHDNVTAKGISIVSLHHGFRELSRIDIHGAMGYQIFSRFIVKIDYQKEEIILYDNDWFNQAANYQQIPLMIQDTQPYINCDLYIKNSPPITARLLVDTGFNHNLMLFENSKTQDIIQSLPKVDITKVASGLGGNIHGFTSYALKMNLGSIDIKRLQTIFPVDKSYADQHAVKNRDGIMGAKLLSNYVIVIDYINQKMYIKDPIKPENQFDPVVVEANIPNQSFTVPYVQLP